MSAPRTGSAAELYERLAVRLLAEPDVEEGTGFGRVPGLRTSKKIFAMMCRGELVVKLPRERVDELVAAGVASRFDARLDGRLMRQWASISSERGLDWEPLALEARRFVSSATRRLLDTPP